MDGSRDVGVLAEDRLQRGFVGDVGLVKDAPAGELDPPGDQRIEDDRGMPVVFQRGCDRAADVPGAAGDQYFHGISPSEV